MKRTLAVLLAMLLGLTLISTGGAESSLPDTEMSGEITHWSWNDYDRDGASRFNEYYPNIKVNYEIVADYDTKFQTVLAAGGDLPDVFNAEASPRAMYYNQDIWEVFDDEPYNIDLSLLVDFSIPLVQNSKGQTVGIQIDNCVGGIAYKRGLAKEYFGTDDPDELEEIFKTPQDYVDKAKEVAEKSGGSVYMFGGSEDVYRTFSSLGQSNKEPLTIDNKLNVRAALGDALSIMESLIQSGSIGPYVIWTAAWNTSFASNDVIFFPGPTWYLSVCVKANDPEGEGDYGVINPPGGSFSWGGTAYSIPKGAKDENKLAAWTYIKWITMSQEGAESFFEAHQTPTLYKPAYDTDLYKNNPDPFFGGQDIIEKYIAISQNPDTMTRPMTVYDNVVGSAIGLALDQMMENGMSATDALDMIEVEAIKLAPELEK